MTIPNNMTSIGDYAFEFCSSLTSVNIGNGVTTISVRAFNGCSGLTSVSIPESVTSIGDRAFKYCNLESVISLIEEPFAITGKTDNYRAFSLNAFNNATLYVPVGTIDKYKATEGWQDFLFITENDADAVTEVKALPVLMQFQGSSVAIIGAKEGTPISVYDLSGKLIGNATAIEGTTNVQTATNDKVVVVRVGNRSVKVMR